MKNIHILPTPNPSKISKDGFDNFYLTEFSESNTIFKNQNIYITSDEEIKDVRPHNGKWHLEKGQILNKFPDYLTDLSECKLVIMTTDQDLIKDGVQAINDVFLEWFVKNPSCEWVEAYHSKIDEARPYMYYLTIPKEEPKKETHICKHCKAETTQSDDECYAKPKQETLENDLLQHIKLCLECNNVDQAIRLIEKYGFEKQQEMYSLKELKTWLIHRDVYLYNYYTTYKKSGIVLQTVEDFIKDSHEYLMDRIQFIK